MESFYMFANFGWGVFFFLLGIAGGVVAAIKLEGWWRVLPAVMAVFCGIGTGLFMYGQFWVDRYMLRGESLSSVPVVGGQLASDLDLLARSKVKSLPEFAEETGDEGLILDGAYLKKNPRSRPGTYARPDDESVILSFIFPDVPEIDRLYVECRMLQSGQWVVLRIFTKRVEKGKIVEGNIWKA